MNSVHEKAKRGIKLIMARQVIVQAVTFGGGVVLARILSPSQFGLYAIATFLVQAFALFGSFGLAPSLIQRKKELADEDLQVGFTLQQVCTTVVVTGLFIGAPWLVSLYPRAPHDSPLQTIWLVRALAFSLYLTSWRSMSALQLERHLKYNRIAAVEVIEILTYQTIAVVLALAGYGVWSFVWATLVRGMLGTFLVYSAAPWRVKLRFDVPAAIHLLRFAIPFQICALINNLSSWITPTLVAGMIGPQAVGYLT
jgi:Membrane protein involved in the export of O-antigen and teichoic acid